MQICLSLNRSRTLSLGLGLQYTLDNIRLADSGITLGNIGGRLVPVALDEPADKSKAVTSSLGIPVRLIYEPVKRLRITAVAYSDFMLGADAIYKKPKEKHSLSGFRAYQFGLGASVAYSGFGFMPVTVSRRCSSMMPAPTAIRSRSGLPIRSRCKT